MKHIIAILLSLVMLFNCIAAPAEATPAQTNATALVETTAHAVSALSTTAANLVTLARANVVNGQMRDNISNLNPANYTNIDQDFDVNAYREDVSARLENESYWTADEVKFLESFGLNLSSDYPATGILEDSEFVDVLLHYPAIFRYQDEHWVLLYLEDNCEGTTRVRWLGNAPDCNCKQYLKDAVSMENFHLDSYSFCFCGHGASNNCYSYGSPYMVVIYCSETGIFEHWSFGKLVASVELPGGTIYAGFNQHFGDIFRSGNKIIAVDGVRFYDPDKPITVTTLCEDAKCVLLADYASSAELGFGAILYETTSSTVRSILHNGDIERPYDHLHGADEGGQFQMQSDYFHTMIDYNSIYLNGTLK